MPPLVVIVGPTCSGKTALSIALATRFDGAVISADSRTVYTGMNIGTAKPSLEERQGIPHYGIDVAEPGEPFSAYDFKRLAKAAIASITSHGKLPFLVGGTGLYVDAVLYDFAFRRKPAFAIRRQVAGLTIEELQARVAAAHLPMPLNSKNPRHLSRLLESGQPPAQIKTMRENTLVIGLLIPQAALKERIVKRVESMLKDGLVEEVRSLMASYGNTEVLRTPEYKAIAAYMRGELSLDDAKLQIVRDDLRLAKRQRTWFKRNNAIHWLSGDDVFEQAEVLVRSFINRG
jgi:tRNA dimethylallyltransferase